MSALADPTLCPDCRAPLDRLAVCTRCGLRLQGPLASRLWETMLEADRLVTQLRAPAPVAPTYAPAPAPAPRVEVPPMPRPAPAAKPPRRLPPMSVPVVLLSLGAICLLVAAVVFVVVTWGSLGLTGRTLVLLGVTGLMAGAARLATRKELRGAAESLWLVVAGMLGLDLLAAHSAGLLGLDTLSGRHSLVLTGVVLGGLGAGVASWTSRRPVTALWGMQAVALAGTALATAAGAWAADDPALGTAVAVPLLAATAYLLRRLPVVAAGQLGIAGVTWVALAATGALRATEDLAFADWWAQLRGWPLLVAAAYAALTTLVGRVPSVLRQVAAGLCLALLAVATVAPLELVDTDRQSLARSLVLLGLAAVVAFVRSTTWRVPAGVLGALGAFGIGLYVVASPWDEPVASTWTVVVAAVATAAVVWAIARAVPSVRPAAPSASATLVGVAVMAAVADQQVEIAVGLGLTLAVGALTWWLRRRDPQALVGSVTGGVGTAYLALLAFHAAAPTAVATAVVATVLTVATAAWYADAERRGPAVGPAVLAFSTVLLGTVTVLAWFDVADASARLTGFGLTAYAVLVALTAHLTSRREWSRRVLEGSALAAGLLAAGIPAAADGALVLGVLGLVTAVVAVWHLDRAAVAWIALGLTGLGAVVRESATSLPHAELYVVPAALLLVLGGLLRTRSDHLLGAGLGHALVALVVLAREPFGTVATVDATAAALLLAGLYVLLERGTREWAAPGAASLAGLFALVALVDGTRTAGLADEPVALVAAGFAALLALASQPASRQEVSRVALEATAAIGFVTALALVREEQASFALVLVVAGTTLAALAAWHRDRVPAGWGALVVLTTALVVDVSLDVQAAELRLVPALALLVLSGLTRPGWRGGTGTLASGVVLGFVVVSGLLAGDLDDRLVVVTATVLALAAAATWVVADRVDAPVESPAAALLAAYAGLAGVLAWTTFLHVGDAALAASLATYAGLVLVVAGPVARRTWSRLALEVSGGLLTLVALGSTPAGTTQPMVLTIVGTSVAIVAVTTRDRELAGWLSMLVLGAATFLRVVDHVRAPELYTLPAAVLLLTAGAWRLHTDAESDSARALGAGLTLALVPSLLLALDEPVSLRALLLGAGAAVVLFAGVAQRLAAPFVAGAGTIALLAVRHLTPMADGVPRWISLGLLGLALLAVGITWESRLRDLRAARAYVAALR